MHEEKKTIHNFNVAAINICLYLFIHFDIAVVVAVNFVANMQKFDCNKCAIERRKKGNSLQNESMRIEVGLAESKHMMDTHLFVSTEE